MTSRLKLRIFWALLSCQVKYAISIFVLFTFLTLPDKIKVLKDILNSSHFNLPGCISLRCKRLKCKNATRLNFSWFIYTCFTCVHASHLASCSWISRESRRNTPCCDTVYCDTGPTYGTRSTHPPLPFYTSLFSRTKNFPLLLNRTFFFAWRCVLLEQPLITGCFVRIT